MNQIEVKLIAYSESIETQKRLATFVIKIPKFVWGHVISHRVFSRNSASSRATPSKRIRKSVLKQPFVPVYFGKNKPGMQSGTALKGIQLWLSKKIWLWSRYFPVFFHFLGEKLKIHKEVLNRILEPWLMVDVIVSATEWSNFISLRTNESAQPEMQYIAQKIEFTLKNSTPNLLKEGEWHLPFLLEEEHSLDIDIKKKICVARCARVSYSLFNGRLSDIENDLKLCEKLSTSGHWSPFEHVATPLNEKNNIGNFVGWKQFRKEFIIESGSN